MQWARDHKKKNPAVVGAVIQLGSCLNLMDTSSNEVLSHAYHTLTATGIQIPQNKPGRHDLDSLVINYANRYAHDQREPYDAVRAAFIEGEPVFKGSTIMKDTHIQLCLRNCSCIISYFRPRM